MKMNNFANVVVDLQPFFCCSYKIMLCYLKGSDERNESPYIPLLLYLNEIKFQLIKQQIAYQNFIVVCLGTYSRIHVSTQICIRRINC